MRPFRKTPMKAYTPAVTRPRPAAAAASGFRWYGPTLLLLLAVLGVMLAGPGMIRSVAHARAEAEVVAVRNGLDGNPSLSSLSDSFKQVARAVEPSVVHVEIQSRSALAGRGMLRPNPSLEGLPDGLLDPFGRRVPSPEPAPPATNNFSDFDTYRPVGNGSGWVYRFPGSEDGSQPAADYILTNAHVVSEVGDTERIRVTLFDRTQATAEIVGRPDTATDVAVLKVVDAAGDILHAAETATGDVEQGEIAFAFGSPFGAQFSFSMSQGIVSAVGRQVGIIGGENTYENFIQTDAAINPGNSGGPLVNVRAEIIGMNTAIATSRGPGGGAANSGVGFAIPVKMATRVADRIIVDGVVRRGFLGVRISDLDRDEASTFGFDGTGVLVESVVEDGAAAAAGMKRGDIITAVDGETVSNSGELRFAIANRRPGREAAIEIFRGDGKQTIDVELGSLDGEPIASAGGDAAPERARDEAAEASDLALRYGITGLRDVTDTLRQRMGLPDDEGVLVTAVRPGSVATSPGVFLRPDDTLITEVMNQPVASVKEFNEALQGFDPQKPIRMTVLQRDPRDPESFLSGYVFLKLP